MHHSTRMIILVSVAARKREIICEIITKYYSTYYPRSASNNCIMSV